MERRKKKYLFVNDTYIKMLNILPIDIKNDKQIQQNSMIKKLQP